MARNKGRSTSNMIQSGGEKAIFVVYDLKQYDDALPTYLRKKQICSLVKDRQNVTAIEKILTIDDKCLQWGWCSSWYACMGFVLKG